MQYAFASIVQARPLPDFGRPVHPFRLQPGTAPQALRIRPHERHPALRTASRAAHEALPPRLDIAPCIRAPVGLEPTRLSRCPAHTMAFSDCSGGHSRPFGCPSRVAGTHVVRPPELLPSSGPCRFPPCHALRLRRGLRGTAPLLIAFPAFRPGRPSDYTLTKLNRFTPQGYGLDVALFTLSPRPHGLGPKTRFSVEG